MFAYLAEFLATLFFAYIVLVTGNPLAIGGALALVLLLSFRFSTVTVNPALTITLAAAGKIPPKEVIPVCTVQVLASLAALEIFKRFNV